MLTAAAASRGSESGAKAPHSKTLRPPFPPLFLNGIEKSTARRPSEFGPRGLARHDLIGHQSLGEWAFPWNVLDLARRYCGASALIERRPSVVDRMENPIDALFDETDVTVREIVEIDHRPAIVAIADDLQPASKPVCEKTLFAAIHASRPQHGPVSMRQRHLLVGRAPRDQWKGVDRRRLIEDLPVAVAKDPDA